MPRQSISARPLGRPSRRAKPTREQKAIQTRESLLRSAAAVVGERGYMNAQIAEITAHAGVAQGTFYNYFESRQDLFDQLLPSIGRQMLEYIKQEASATSTAIDREMRSFRAFFTFLQINPSFYRILYEAELFAPTAFEAHMGMVSRGYVRSLERALDEGALIVRDRGELEALSFLLMGARHYLAMRFARQDGRVTSVPEWVVRSYENLVTRGMYRPPSDGD